MWAAGWGIEYMSRIGKLIQELCPDGVAFYPLSQVAHYAKKRIDVSQVDETTCKC